jgi:hypothetical protein
MLVADIIDEASEIIGLTAGNPRLYKLITRAIKMLKNKGNFDPLLVYVEMNVTNDDNILTLPREIEVPIRININQHPTFSRSKLYEFSLNGPGSDDRQFTGYSWLDQNTVPIMAELPSTGTAIKVVPADASFAGDNGKKVKLWGKDVNGNELHGELAINHAAPPTTVSNLWRSVERVRKDETQQRVRLVMPNGDELANYYPYEVNPEYRRIKLSRKGAAVKMLCRRTTFEVFSDDDYIPLHSELAVLVALRAVWKFTHAEPGTAGFTEAENLEKKALQYLEEEQASRDTAMQIAKEQEDSPIANLTRNNRDSVIMADVYDDASKIFGPVGREKLFDLVTDALDLLLTKFPAWSGTDGYVDLRASKQKFVTLPRYVDIPLKIKIGNTPLEFRNRWFEFHQGGWCGDMMDCRSYRDVGEVVTVNDPPGPCRLVVINDLPEDNDCKVVVEGCDACGKVLRTPNEDLDDEEHPWRDGIELTGHSANTLPDQQQARIKRITRITRTATQGYVRLLGFNDSFNTVTLIGYFYPDETEPRYRRIRLPQSCDWIRMRYRKRDLKITALTDPLHLKSKLAIVAAMRAIKSYGDGKDADGQAHEKTAVRWLREKEVIQAPAGSVTFECGDADFASSEHGPF